MSKSPSECFKRFKLAYSKSFHWLYNGLAGIHPNENLLHHQWLSVKDLRKGLKEVLSSVSAKVLDVGCGKRPYRMYLDPRRVTIYVGIDSDPTSDADLLVSGAQHGWPFQNQTFDAIICTEVLEHVHDPQVFIGELSRVLKPGGLLILSVPFIFNMHGEPRDFFRFTEFGLLEIVSKGFEIIDLKRQGAVGSTLAILLLNWIPAQMDTMWLGRTLGIPILFFRLCANSIVNLIASLVDRLDFTDRFYSHLLLIAKRK